MLYLRLNRAGIGQVQIKTLVTLVRMVILVPRVTTALAQHLPISLAQGYLCVSFFNFISCGKSKCMSTFVEVIDLLPFFCSCFALFFRVGIGHL